MNKTVNAPVNDGTRVKAGHAQVLEIKWRRVPESNRSTRICNPLHNLPAHSPFNNRH